MNIVMYKKVSWGRGFNLQLLVSNAKFDRRMLRIMEGSTGTKTVTFPNTIRENSEDAFSGTSVQSAVLNEDLEKIGVRLFRGSKIKKITIPRNVTRI